jgi:hypothetical protein
MNDIKLPTTKIIQIAQMEYLSTILGTIAAAGLLAYAATPKIPLNAPPGPVHSFFSYRLQHIQKRLPLIGNLHLMKSDIPEVLTQISKQYPKGDLFCNFILIFRTFFLATWIAFRCCFKQNRSYNRSLTKERQPHRFAPAHAHFPHSNRL